MTSGSKKTEIEIPAQEAHSHVECLTVMRLALKYLRTDDTLGWETRRRLEQHIRNIEKAGKP